MTSLPPSLIFLFGALLIPLLPFALRRIYAIILPLFGLANMWLLETGSEVIITFWQMDLTLVEADRLSMVFGWIFNITVLTWSIFSWHLDDKRETTSAYLYGGSALGVVFAGDYLTLFLNWEIMALASAVVVASGNHRKARLATMRYLFVHLMGGVFLLFGICLLYAETGSLELGPLPLDDAASWMILLAFAVNSGMPPFSSWLADSYPESSATGTVFLSAFTTKTTVYCLATVFLGEPLLIYMGAFMSLYGIVYALNENDARRVLCYSIINQVGFMICGVGIGTQLALDGVAAHAFCHILYKALLLMSAGAVMYQTGRTKCTDLGGLWRTMPVTLFFAVIGAISISSMPFTNGFISKSMITSAAAYEHQMVAYVALLAASAGVALHAGIKFPFFVFFNIDRGLRPKEAPLHMHIAMGIVAFLCIGLGVYPDPLYAILPLPVTESVYVPYTLDHVTGQFQMLLASGIAFYFMLPFLKRTETISLDFDWLYRKGGNAFLAFVDGPLMRFFAKVGWLFHERIPSLAAYFTRNPPKAMRLIAMRGRLAMAALFGRPENWDRSLDAVQNYQARYDRSEPASLLPIDRTAIYMTIALLIYLSVYLLN